MGSFQIVAFIQQLGVGSAYVERGKSLHVFLVLKKNKTNIKALLL